MQLKTFVVGALAATAAAERIPYKLARKSASLVALAARQEPGYQPEQTFCGEGDDCAAACGEGYAQCASNDNLSHCYNKGAGEVCCGDHLGNACEKDFYCAKDSVGETWCCPDGMTPEECAAEYEVTGGLSSLIPSATNTANGAGPTSSCGDGAYCAQDSEGKTWCCPEGMTTEECADDNDVTGGLTSVIPSATTTSYGADPTDSCGDDAYCAEDSDGKTWCCPKGKTPAECAADYEVTGGLTSVIPTATNTAYGADPTDSCGEGSYCAEDSEGKTWCCPEGKTPAECAADYEVTGGLTSVIPSATKTAYGAGPTGGYGGGYGGSNITTPSAPGAPSATSDPSTIPQTAAGAFVAGSGVIAVIVAAAAALI